mgnify:CR=1 FL=1
MLLEMKVPSPGESISEVEIAEWMVNDGDYVEKDETIAEIDSDKATLELPAEDNGVIKILVEAGEVVAVGDIVCIIDTSVKGESKKKDKKPEANIEPHSRKATIESIKTTPLASVMKLSGSVAENLKNALVYPLPPSEISALVTFLPNIVVSPEWFI